MRAVRLSFALLLFAASAAHAQNTGVVKGTVRGPDGNPLGGQNVVLHRVNASSGITVASATSAPDGSFRLTVKDADADTDAVYFLAARYENELYIGDAFKAPFDSAAAHAVRVGVAESSARNLVSGNVQSALPAAPAGDDPTQWLVWLLPALAVATIAAVTLGGRGRMPEHRRILLAIAKLDAEHAGDGDDAADGGAYRAQRAELVAHITRTSEV